MNDKLPRQILASDLQLGDVIRPNDSPFSDSIVKKVTLDSVTIWRPYGTTADFSYTGGVICYIGVEEYSIPRSTLTELTLLRRRTLR